MDLAQALAGYAGWLGHGHADRAAAWVARLGMNAPEIDAFRAAPTPDVPVYQAMPTRVDAPKGVGAGDAHLPTDAIEALQRARQRADLNAFTYLPDRLEPAGRGILAGVPIAVKDLMLVKGMPITAGSHAMDAQVAPRDAEIVARLRRAGAVVIGLANLHEFAYGITSDNPRFGRVVNPAAPSRIPGGSSGGSAAAIAATGLAITAVAPLWSHSAPPAHVATPTHAYVAKAQEVTAPAARPHRVAPRVTTPTTTHIAPATSKVSGDGSHRLPGSPHVCTKGGVGAGCGVPDDTIFVNLPVRDDAIGVSTGGFVKCHDIPTTPVTGCKPKDNTK